MSQFQQSPMINASDIEPAPHTFQFQFWPVRFDPIAPEFCPYLLLRATLEDGTIADMKIEARSAVKMIEEMLEATKRAIAAFTSNTPGEVIPIRKNMIILQHCCLVCGALVAVAYSKKQLPTITGEPSAEKFAQAKAEHIASGLQFIVAAEGKTTCAKCKNPLNPLDLLSDWQTPEEPEEF